MSQSAAKVPVNHRNRKRNFLTLRRIGAFSVESESTPLPHKIRLISQVTQDMPNITYVEFDGTQHTIDAEIGVSIMQNAMNNNVPGIDADCGGECSCATCHVILDDEWFYRLGEPSENEDAMLGLNPERTENSRLSCQIEVSEDMEGLTLALPEFQF